MIISLVIKSIVLSLEVSHWLLRAETDAVKEPPRKKKKKRLVFIIKPTGASASTWKAVEKQLEVTEEVAAPQVCADTDSVCPCTCVFHAVIYMNRARWCQCSDQAQQCQVQQWVSSFFSQLLLPLECYHHFYSVSMIYH